jgi:hypothetical protein
MMNRSCPLNKKNLMGRIVKTVVRTSILCTKYFINNGGKEKLVHLPIDQLTAKALALQDTARIIIRYRNDL